MPYFLGSTDFEYAPATGVLKVATGKTIDSATAATYTLALVATPVGTSAPGAAVLTVTVDPECSGAAKLTAVLSMFTLAVLAAVSF